MGRVSGDKGRFNKQRRQKIAKRALMRGLLKEWKAAAAGAPAKPKAADS